jgi:hypothetical protein
MAGDGSLAYAAQFVDTGATLAGTLLSAPPPEVLVTLALEYLATGGEALPPDQIVPEYLRAPDARINWYQRGPAATPGQLPPITRLPRSRQPR